MDAGRIIAGACLSLGLVGLSVGLSGNGARALALVRPPAEGLGGVAALSGSATGRVQEVVLNGRSMRSLECRSRRSPESVLSHYAEIAEAQLAPGVPYIKVEDGPAGGSLHWIDPQGVARAVLVESDPYGGGTRYRILIDESGRTLGSPGQDAALPLGLRPSDFPRATVESSVAAPDGSGLLMLRAPGDPAAVAGRLLGPIEARGFRCDRSALRAYEAASGLLVIPLKHPSGVQGTLSITPGEGESRACLSLHPAN